MTDVPDGIFISSPDRKMTLSTSMDNRMSPSDINNKVATFYIYIHFKNVTILYSLMLSKTSIPETP